MDSKMTFEEAREQLLSSYWKTEPCGTENCWCLMVSPVEPILYDDDKKEMYVSGAGELSKDIAEYIVSLHNERLEREKPWIVSRKSCHD